MAGLFNWLSLVGSITKFGLLSLPQRRGSVTATIMGIAGVVAVLVGVLSIAAGFQRVMTSSGSPDSAIVLRSGADSEMVSGLQRQDTRVIADAPGVARGTRGPLASAELFVILNLPKRSTGTDANVPLRGIEHAALEVRDQVRFTAGRRFEWGHNEVVVGIGAAREFAGLDVGSRIRVGREDWRVVGVFAAGGSVAESEIWCDARVLQPAYGRGDSFQSVYVRLNSAGSFSEFQDALASDPRVSVKVMRQSEYFAEHSEMITRLITSLGVLIAGLMALGAVFGALNTMYSAVGARAREIATLRALGFGRSTVIVAVLIEALLLALVGGALGGGVAYLAFNNFQTATINWQSFSQVAFAFAVTPQLLVQGIVWATLIGLVGGLLPALRAARLPVVSALREL